MGISIDPYLRRLETIKEQRDAVLKDLQDTFVGKTCLCSHLPPYFKGRRVPIRNVVFNGGIVFIIEIICDPQLDGNDDRSIKQGAFYRTPQGMAGHKRIKAEHIDFDSIEEGE